MQIGARTAPNSIMSDLPANLRLLCGYRPSISMVARELGINRSQLNRYLSGASTPRLPLMHKICDYFGVEDYELHLPKSDFAAIVKLKGLAFDSVAHTLRMHFDRIAAHNDQRIVQLTGMFFEYHWSMAAPGKIIRALNSFALEGEHLFYRRLERMGDPTGPVRRHFRYQGFAVMTGDRVFMSDYETGAGIEITQTILYPDYSLRWMALHGVKCSVSGNHNHVPCAVRVFLERVPSQSNLIANLRSVGLFDPDDPRLPSHILPLIDNKVSGPFVFAAHAG
jgi:transcriptional regulator with XRE-family HTH domain